MPDSLFYSAPTCFFAAKPCRNYALPQRYARIFGCRRVRPYGTAKAGANIIINLSASDETIGKAEYRRKLISMQSAKLICGYIYADASIGESTTDMVFAGHKLIAENGTVLAQSKLFDTGCIVSSWMCSVLTASDAE